jgi:6-phosphogluconolactonase/glucosamine-6-phosphate isomerase/deaminase
LILKRYDDLESLNRAAAGLFARLAEQAVKAGGVSAALSGGRTPRRAYELPAQLINLEAGALYWLVDREAAAELG